MTLYTLPVTTQTFVVADGGGNLVEFGRKVSVTTRAIVIACNAVFEQELTASDKHKINQKLLWWRDRRGKLKWPGF